MKIFKWLFPLLVITACFQCCQENELVDNYIIDSENSVLEWQGYNYTACNSGALKLVANNIKAEKGRIISGTITVPMTSFITLIQQEELEDFFKSDLLLETFMSQDIIFQIKGVDLLHGIHSHAIPGANWWVRGDITMMGQTHQVIFPAKIKLMANDMDIEAKFTIDYTKWGIGLDENGFIRNNSIDPLIDLHLKGKASINNRIII